MADARTILLRIGFYLKSRIGRSLGETFLHGGRFFVPWVTVGFIVAALILHFSYLVIGVDQCALVNGHLIYWNRMSFESIWMGDAWFALTAFGYTFVHAEYDHLMNNIFSVLIAGYFVEKRFVETGLGRRRYLASALAYSAIAATTLDVWKMAQGNFMTMAAGMSGVAYGLFGAAFIGRMRAPLALKMLFGLWVIDQVGATIRDAYLMVSGPDVAHSAAFATGLVVALALRRGDRSAETPSQIAIVPPGASVEQREPA